MILFHFYLILIGKEHVFRNWTQAYKSFSNASGIQVQFHHKRYRLNLFRNTWRRSFIKSKKTTIERMKKNRHRIPFRIHLRSAHLSKPITMYSTFFIKRLQINTTCIETVTLTILVENISVYWRMSNEKHPERSLLHQQVALKCLHHYYSQIFTEKCS